MKIDKNIRQNEIIKLDLENWKEFKILKIQTKNFSTNTINEIQQILTNDERKFIVQEME
jgi:hypothetical protein